MQKPKNINLKDIEKGTTFAFYIYVKEDGLTINITGYTVYFTAKEFIGDSDANAKIDKKITTHVEPLNGKSEIALSSSDTDITAGSYYYAIDIKDTAGNVIPVVRGRVKITEPVRQTKD